MEKYLCESKKEIDNCVLECLAERKIAGLVVVKITYNSKLYYAIYGYQDIAHFGERFTRFYRDVKKLIKHHPETTFLPWTSATLYTD